jgi:hypothetical protein
LYLQLIKEVHHEKLQQQGNYNMNFTKENIPATLLENEKVLAIRDLRVLGIYTFVLLMIQQGEYTVTLIIDKMKEQFFIEDKEVLDALKIIIDDLMLITMVKEK